MSYKILIPTVLSGSGVKFLKNKGCEVVIEPSEDKFLARIGDFDAVLSGGLNGLFFGSEVLDKSDRLKVISNFSAGYENIDIDYAAKKGIYVTNSGAANSNAVAEHTMYLILACAKNANIMAEAAADGNFEIRKVKRNIELRNKVLGIIGCGHIGRIVAQKAMKGFDMQVLAYDPYIRPELIPEGVCLLDGINDLLERADFITIHQPLTDSTFHSIGLEQFRKMKHGSYFINAARGGLVDEGALLKALDEKMIAGAGLDVFEQEPTDPANPLLKRKNVIVSPHCAPTTVESIDRMELFAAQDLWNVLNGRRPKFPVNNPDSCANISHGNVIP